MNTLCVIDVSAVVYTGLYSQRYQDRSAFGYPTGGIHFFMEQLLVPLYEYNDIVLCFDSPNFRKKLESSYKSGRSHNAVAISQIEALYEYLSYCGFSCYKCDGYEADDIIDWVIDTFKEKYSPIIIVGNDMDLAHSIRPNVIFRSCRIEPLPIHLAIDHHQVITLATLYQIFAVAVEHLATGRILNFVAQRIAPGQLLIFAVDELNISKPRGDYAENDQHDHLQHPHPGNPFPTVTHSRTVSLVVNSRASSQMKPTVTALLTTSRTSVWNNCAQDRDSNMKNRKWCTTTIAAR